MKFLLSRKLIIALMLLAVFKAAVPVVVLDSSVAGTSYNLQVADDQGIEKNCHGNDTAEFKACCYTGCDHKYTSNIFNLGTWQQGSAGIPVKLVATDLYTIYSQPVNPPPIQV